MEGDPEKGSQIMKSIAGQGANLVVTIGSEAAMAAKKDPAGLPVVYTMVLEKQDFGGTPASGILMQADIVSQIRSLRQLFPGSKKIGVIYNIHYSGAVINLARQSAEGLGLSLIPIAVETQNDISSALSKLTRDQIDVLWSVVDPTVAQPEAMQMLIQHTLKEKIPFIALSKFHVKGGALAAFSVDYQDMGAQTAELAKEMLKNPKTRPAAMPRHLILFMNPDTQEKIGLKALPQIAGIQIVTE
jgi:putative ABC transport system substrate-binding protein